MTERDDEYRYSVAWIDCLARGSKMGRAVLTRSDHARLEDLPPARRAEALRFDPVVRAEVPVTPPSGLLNPVTVAAFNELWFRKAPRSRRGQLQTIATYFHPLDGVGAWNRMYGARGFVQYQFVVPFGAEDALRDVLTRLSQGRMASFVTVLKRFGPADPGPLSFPVEGWTLAFDLPVGPLSLGPAPRRARRDRGRRGRSRLSRQGCPAPTRVARDHVPPPGRVASHAGTVSTPTACSSRTCRVVWAW